MREAKRVKVSGYTDAWGTFVVLVDGVQLDVEAVTFDVRAGESTNTVTLVLSAMDVELDIRTSPQVGGAFSPIDPGGVFPPIGAGRA